jgi:cytochrome c-type biogenesis protein CcmF
MVVSHLGLAVAAMGMASESAFSIETLAALSPGETRQVGPYALTRSHRSGGRPELDRAPGHGFGPLRRGEADTLTPQARVFANPPGTRTESALKTRWNGQLYVVLGEEAQDGRWQMRFWWKPFVPLIWLGGLLVGLGGFLALIGRVARDVKRLVAIDKIAFRRERQGR